MVAASWLLVGPLIGYRYRLEVPLFIALFFGGGLLWLLTTFSIGERLAMALDARRTLRRPEPVRVRVDEGGIELSETDRIDGARVRRVVKVDSIQLQVRVELDDGSDRVVFDDLETEAEADWAVQQIRRALASQ